MRIESFFIFLIKLKSHQVLIALCVETDVFVGPVTIDAFKSKPSCGFCFLCVVLYLQNPFEKLAQCKYH